MGAWELITAERCPVSRSVGRSEEELWCFIPGRGGTAAGGQPNAFIYAFTSSQTLGEGVTDIHRRRQLIIMLEKVHFAQHGTFKYDYK